MNEQHGLTYIIWNDSYRELSMKNYTNFSNGIPWYPDFMKFFELFE